MVVCGAITLQAQTQEPVYEKAGDQVKATFYHDNGAIAQVGHFKDGKLHGDWVMYNAEGKKIALGQYVDGARNGKWFFWKGESLKEVDYSDNRIISVVDWDNGTEIVVYK